MKMKQTQGAKTSSATSLPFATYLIFPTQHINLPTEQYLMFFRLHPWAPYGIYANAAQNQTANAHFLAGNFGRDWKFRFASEMS
jgi:hypothetical protein